MIRTRLVLLSLAALLAACAPTPTVYGPAAASPSGVGYSELRIENDRWRVSYIGRPGASAQEVEALALRRAGEIALMNGYEWFTLADQRIETAGGRQDPVRVSGGLGQTWGSGGFSGTSLGIGISLSPGQSQRAVARLEILTGRGEPRPEGAFDAAAVSTPPPSL